MNSKNKHITDNIVWTDTDSTKDTFQRIYRKNIWGSDESVSGKGSEKSAVQNILKQLPLLFGDLNIKTITDAPCGDYGWMKELNYNFQKYVGIDIVENLITENKKNYEKENVIFKCENIIETVCEKTDLILCRDCLIHLSFKDIFSVLNNFKKSSSVYLLTTTYKNIKQNTDIFTGSFRKTDLTLPPFNFPNPEFEIREENDKYLSLWRFCDL